MQILGGYENVRSAFQQPLMAGRGSKAKAFLRSMCDVIAMVAYAVKDVFAEEDNGYIPTWGAIPPLAEHPIITTTAPLPMISKAPIPPGKQTDVVGRPQASAFKPHKIVLQNPERWVFNDMKVGNRSQLVQAGDIPGVVFADGKENNVDFETVQTAMDFVFRVTYIGDNPNGEIFEATVFGKQRN